MKYAIVTGAAHGLGKEITAELSRAGYFVGAVDIDEEQLNQNVASIPNTMALPADVTQPDQVELIFEKFGKTPDLLVNNAGIVRFGEIVDQPYEDLLSVLHVNLLAPILCAKKAASLMTAVGKGNIINISSVAAVHPSPGVGMYAGTKAGLANMTDLMAIELGPKGIRVNAIAPGFIDSGMSAPAFENQKVREKRASGVPTQRLGLASDVAKAVLFLDSDAADYINGHQLVVDGGVTKSVFVHLPRE